jgi:hypothetical protein
MASAMRRGQISIDRIVAIRSSVLPLYIIVQADGTVKAADEVSEDGFDFLTTKMHGDQISFQSIQGHYLSAAGGDICTKRYCSTDERFVVEKRETQYAFRARCGKYLRASDREPFVGLSDTCDDTEVFQLFSLMMFGVNVGKQLELLERQGQVVVSGLLDDEEVQNLRSAVASQPGEQNGHEFRGCGIVSESLARIAAHPIVVQLTLRVISSKAKLSLMESCRTDAEHVRKELEVTTWHVTHPYDAVEFPGAVDARLSLTAIWLLDDFDPASSTWAWVRPPCLEGCHQPRLPQFCSPEEVEAITRTATPLAASRGALWLYLGPIWLSNTIGAASFWKDYDAQTRYKHLSGQAEPSFRALTDAQRNCQPREEMCPTLLSATYIREYLLSRDTFTAAELAALSERTRCDLQQVLRW